MHECNAMHMMVHSSTHGGVQPEPSIYLSSTTLTGGVYRLRRGSYSPSAISSHLVASNLGPRPHINISIITQALGLNINVINQALGLNINVITRLSASISI